MSQVHPRPIGYLPLHHSHLTSSSVHPSSRRALTSAFEASFSWPFFLHLLLPCASSLIPYPPTTPVQPQRRPSSTHVYEDDHAGFSSISLSFIGLWPATSSLSSPTYTGSHGRDTSFFASGENRRRRHWPVPHRFRDRKRQLCAGLYGQAQGSHPLAPLHRSISRFSVSSTTPISYSMFWNSEIALFRSSYLAVNLFPSTKLLLGDLEVN